MKSLRGFAALGIIIHHISQADVFFSAAVFPAFNNAGDILVAIFFFCSGYGLIKSFAQKDDYLNGFIKKRVLKSIILPFYVNILLYGLITCLCEHSLNQIKISSLLGITLLNLQAWFPIALAILYILFYFCFRYSAYINIFVLSIIGFRLGKIRLPKRILSK